MSAPRVLVVDDEPAIRRTLRANLAARGYDVAVAGSGDEALQLAAERPPQLVILDLMLPGLSGLEGLPSLARGIDGADPGAVGARRGEHQGQGAGPGRGRLSDQNRSAWMSCWRASGRCCGVPLRRRSPAGVVHAGALTIDLDARQVGRDGLALELTAREFDVLGYLARHAGKVITHRMLLAEVWGPEYGNEVQYLRVFINRLRRKIEDDPTHPRYIVTEPGVGYRLLPLP